MLTPLKLAVLLTTACSLTACSARASDDLFASNEAALRFTASLGPDWRQPIETIDQTLSTGHRTAYRYEIHGLKGMMVREVDREGRPRLYEVRFPVRSNQCVGALALDTLAKALLANVKPDSMDESRNVNLVASLPELVWPYEGVMISPSAQIGNTAFKFTRIKDHCEMTVFRMAKQT